MSAELWTRVDDYIDEHLIDDDPALAAALAASAAAGLPPIAVTPAQGKLLSLLVRVHGASSILEVGTLGGYSTIWLARALADGGRLLTLELDPGYAAVASANIERAGLGGRVEVRVGAARESMDALIAAGEGPFDMVFIDADKASTPAYFERALELTRPGSVILVDNVIRDGRLVDAGCEDPGVQGNASFHELLARDREGARRVSRDDDPDGRREGLRRLHVRARRRRALTGAGAPGQVL